MKQRLKFIDYYGSLYMESARIPAPNRMILNLCEELFREKAVWRHVFIWLQHDNEPPEYEL